MAIPINKGESKRKLRRRVFFTFMCSFRINYTSRYKIIKDNQIKS